MLARHQARFVVLVFVALSFAVLPAFSQTSEGTGKLKIHVSPKQAYVFVDGKAIREGDQSIRLTAGPHEVGVDNYGYTPKTQKVQISAGETTDLDVTLQRFGDQVAGPFGDIEFKGDPRAAVLLNGTTPAYFVGHVDEFNWNWIWHQRLLVNPGTYQVMVTREGNTIWEGPVTVKAGQQVTVYLDRNGATKTKEWAKGNTIGPQPRFHAGIASATVPVAPVTAQLTAQPTNLTCGQSANLNWTSANAVDTTITNLGEVATTGDGSVTPTRTMTYQITAKGPGGEVTKIVDVDVNSQPTATVSLSEPEVHYHKVGDKVVQDDSTTLNWSASNADNVTITPLGSEPTSGSQTIEAQPTQTNPGPVDERVSYTIEASNACGGTATQTASLHIVGSIDPPPSINLASLFYPTNYPTMRHPKVGLVRSQQQTLVQIAKHFKNYQQYNEDARLMIVGHTDTRKSQEYNMALSERRADLVKNYLVSNGIAADEIQTRAVGKEQELPVKEVEKLQMKDPQKPEKGMMRSTKVTWLAYNRRVDVILEPTGQQSALVYPNDAPDSRILWEASEPSLKKVEMAAKAPIAAGSLHAGLTNNK
jgi:outer membrane protein OmpA-like peptidoglycan-associated protein